MPYQVSWQFVSMKSQTPVHVLGADADGVADVLAGAALLAAGSAAHAPLAAPAGARIVAAKMLSLVMGAPPAPTLAIVTLKMSVARHIPTLAKNFDPSGVRTTAKLLHCGHTSAYAWPRELRQHVRSSPKATESMRRNELPLCAVHALTRRSKQSRLATLL